MSRKSIVCTVVALAMILMGTGYAYWTDTLNVTTNASTGDLDVTFADLGLYAQYGNERQADNWSIIDGIDTGFVSADFFARGASDYNAIAGGNSIANYYDRADKYNDVTFDAKLVDASAITATVGPYNPGNTNGSDKIELTINQMYPGYAQAFRTDILNVGSIAAKLSAIGFDVTGANNATRNMLGVAILIDREYSTPGEDGFKIFGLAEELGLAPDQYFTLGGVDFVRFSALADVTEKLEAADSNLYCIPSENRMDLYIGVAMDPDAEGVYTTGSTEVMANNDDAASQNKTVKLSIDFLWDQFNAGSDVDSTNRLENQNVGQVS